MRRWTVTRTTVRGFWIRFWNAGIVARDPFDSSTAMSRKVVIEVDEALRSHIGNELEKEIINILIDSGLYLDLELRERFSLLHFIEASYFKDASR